MLLFFSTCIITSLFILKLHPLLLKNTRTPIIFPNPASIGFRTFCCNCYFLHSLYLSLIFCFCPLNVPCMSFFFFPFICSFEVLMRISLTLQVCSVTVTVHGKSVFYQNNVEKSNFIYWESILDDLKAAIWFQLHPINARQSKELSP